jgi:hypothetical protein
LNQILADNCGRKLDDVQKDTERDNWLDANEALSYGIVDKITASRNSLANDKK